MVDGLGPAGWLSLAAVCALGAISPGPSLAVVLRNTLIGSRREGMLTAISHGVGVGLYALAVALGLAVVIAGSPTLFRALQLGGALFLLYLGVRALTSRGALDETGAQPPRRGVNGLRDGFLIAFLNPKIAIFFLALFSQFVRPSAQLPEKLLMALLAAGIDTAWYLLVAAVLSHGPVLGWLRRRAVWIDRVFGVLLVALAIRVAFL